MPNLTLVIPEKTKNRMAKHSSVRWSNVVRTVIESKLDSFEKADRLACSGNLSTEKLRPISEKIDVAMRKHARKLLDENYG